MNRKDRRDHLKDLSLEERTREALAREHIIRMNKCQAKMKEHWLPILEKNVPAWARWISSHFPPKFYIAMVKYLLMTCPRSLTLSLRAFHWEIKGKNHVLPDILVTLIHFGCSLITLPLSLVFMYPFLWMRKTLSHWGVWVKIDRIEKKIMRLRVIKWWQIIDESVYEI